MVPLEIIMICNGNSNSGVVLIWGMKITPMNRLENLDSDQAFISGGYRTCLGSEMGRERRDRPVSRVLEQQDTHI